MLRTYVLCAILHPSIKRILALITLVVCKLEIRVSLYIIKKCSLRLCDSLAQMKPLKTSVNFLKISYSFFEQKALINHRLCFKGHILIKFQCLCATLAFKVLETDKVSHLSPFIFSEAKKAFWVHNMTTAKMNTWPIS